MSEIYLMITDLAMIGPRLKQLRAETGLTQAEVAEACSIYQNTVSNFEKSGEGSLSALFTLLDFYQKKLAPKRFDFLADTFTISESQLSLADIAAERLLAFKTESGAMLEEIITQLKGTGLQQL